MEFKKEIEQAIAEMGFVDFTEIQKMTIPLLLEGRDVIGHSHTGTGKTAAFGIPILESIDVENDHVQALIICPTRELAVQIKDEMGRMAKYMTNIRMVAVYGGDPITNQIYALKKKPQIIIGTPGRTIDLLERKLLKFENLKYFVLDEADEMLKMGFQEDIEKIFNQTPEVKQTLMFSATMPRTILALAKSYMNDPEMVKVIGEESTNSDIVQYYYKVKKENKTEAIYRLLNIYRPKLSLIFCNTKVQVDELTQELISRGVNCDKIHGDLPQTTRLDVLKKFHVGLIDVMVATDVAARGLDIKAVEAVFNYDVPEKADYYIHRIGRTGRIGHIGYSFTLVSRGELKQVEEIERIVKTKIKKRSIPTYDKVRDVKDEKFIQKLQGLIETEPFEKEYETLNKLIQAKMTEDQIIVALIKIISKNEQESVNQADINEEFETKGPRSFAGFGNQTSRFHMNVGKNDGLTVSDLLDFVTAKVKMQRKDIQDIAILTEFTFFNVPTETAPIVLEILKASRLKGKKVQLTIAKYAKDDKNNPKRA
jgi:ATP-dependent RNA helicase DeaD